MRSLIRALILGFVLLEALTASGQGVVRIEYKRDDFDFVTVARATVGGRLLAEARRENFEGGGVVVREIHYAPATGAKVYEGLLMFGPGGVKTGEKRISGRKTSEIFAQWPW